MNAPARARPKVPRSFIFKAAIIPMALSGIIVLQDLCMMLFHRSSFYLSESFLFSSFWWFFAPFLYLQYRLSQFYGKPTLTMIVLNAFFFAALHLVSFPAFVWLVSGLCFDHTFRYGQTFQFVVSQYLYVLLLVYPAVSLLVRNASSRRAGNNAKVLPGKVTSLATHLTVTGSEGTTNIRTSDILYFSANPPYINIHHRDRKYLQQGSLKSMSLQLDALCFIRVHKSTIVNMAHVKSYTSRMNGDYDLLMTDGTHLRLSRNYAGNFRKSFPSFTQDATE